MAGRVYSAQFSGVAVTAQQDFFEVNAPADAVVEILEIHLSQDTEVKDAEEEQLTLALKTGATTSGSGGSTPTAVARELGMPAFGGTVEANNTTKASAGTIVTHETHSWNVRGPFDRIFTPETTIIVSPSARFTFELTKTPGDSITMSGFVVFREIGG
jgi:hypothetical protein